MKNSIKLLAALAIVGFAGTAMAQNSNTATGTANANIITPISVAPSGLDNGTLNFGNIVSIAGVGTVVELGNAITSYTAGENPGSNNAGTISDATFSVAGAPSAFFSNTAGAVTGLPAGFSVALVGDNSSNQLDPSGHQTLTYSGTLTVPAGAPAQSVSGTWTETVAYN